LLSAKSALLEISAAAAGAVRSRIFLVKTIVADQPLWAAVVGEGDAAMRTRRNRAAVDALNE
jgi:hypothetical protein